MKTVLVVDDNDDVREGARRVLEQEGYVTLGAGNGHEALDVLEQHPASLPCVIVVDLSMPVMDGWQLLRILGDDERWARIPRLIMTAYGGDLGNQQAPVLRKPFDGDALIAAVDEACAA
jgi:CheY-like chemotaxis protein